jgi:hypothetical protein
VSDRRGTESDERHPLDDDVALRSLARNRSRSALVRRHRCALITLAPDVQYRYTVFFLHDLSSIPESQGGAWQAEASRGAQKRPRIRMTSGSECVGICNLIQCHMRGGLTVHAQRWSP